MDPGFRDMGRRISAGVAILVWIGTAASALGDGATRDLPEFYEPGVLLNVAIVIVAPPGTGTMGLEDVLPSGWTNVSNISDGGIYESDNKKVKWPPFFSNPSRMVSYDVTPPGAAVGAQCFAGYVSFDGDEIATTGDDCTASLPAVPAASVVGLIVMGLMILVAATLVLRGAERGKQGGS